MAQPFDLGEGKVTGEARPVADGVLELPAAAFAAFSASARAASPSTRARRRRPCRIELRDRKGPLLRSLGTPGMYRAPSFSPDGRWIAATGHPQAGRTTTTSGSSTLAGASAVRFTLEPTEDVEAVWSPDGKTLFYGSNANGPHDIYRKSVDGTRAGGARLRGARAAETDERLARRQGPPLQLRGGRAERPPRARPRDGAAPGRSARARSTTRTASLSPDGRWLPSSPTRPAGRRSTSRRSRGRAARGPSRPTGGATRTGAGTGARSSTPRSTAGCSRCRRSRGRHLPGRRGDGALPDDAAPRDYRDWGMSPDGQRFAIVPSGVLEAKNELRLIVNWPARRENRR